MNMDYKPNQAVVFDIDDTLIDSLTRRPIKIVMNMYNYCVERGYTIYIITARTHNEPNLKRTLEELQSIGVTKGNLYMRPSGRNSSLWKRDTRKNILEEVVMSIGDKHGDIGEYGGIGVLVYKDHKTLSHKYVIKAETIEFE